MKQKYDVSIAGIAFQLDDEGYLLLDNYLSQIAAIYKNNPDGAEVLADIEGRICELILERQPADRPVPIELLRHIVEQLGMPDSFPEETIPTSNSHISNCPEQENASAQTDSQSHTSSNTSGENTANTQSRLNQPPTDMPRRLYRNAENARIGGVCSGLGTFFRVDPIVFRLCFLLPLPLTMLVAVIPGISAMTGFFGVLFAISIVAYPLLWFAIPMARTPRQKLEMRGEAITATTIQKSVQKGHLPNKKNSLEPYYRCFVNVRPTFEHIGQYHTVYPEIHRCDYCWGFAHRWTLYCSRLIDRLRQHKHCIHKFIQYRIGLTVRLFVRSDCHCNSIAGH